MREVDLGHRLDAHLRDALARWARDLVPAPPEWERIRPGDAWRMSGHLVGEHLLHQMAPTVTQVAQVPIWPVGSVVQISEGGLPLHDSAPGVDLALAVSLYPCSERGALYEARRHPPVSGIAEAVPRAVTATLWYTRTEAHAYGSRGRRESEAASRYGDDEIAAYASTRPRTLLVRGVFDAAEVARIDAHGRGGVREAARLEGHRLVPAKRRSSVSWIDLRTEPHAVFGAGAEWYGARIDDLVASCAVDVVPHLGMYPLDCLRPPPRAQYTIYDGAGERFHWHMDAGPRNRRSVTVIVMLCGADHGGELQVANVPRSELRMAPGDALLIPATAWHQVTPVIAGERRSLVVWYELR